jgi:outer membrane receptor for ferrienterochelin and colicins
MTKKLFFPLAAFVVLSFVFSLAISTPILAQEKQKEEDIEDFSLEDLLNVEITTAGKKAQKVSDIPASVVVITRADIEKFGYVTLNEILENVPGLYGIDQRDVSGMRFGVRGFWSSTANSIILLLNGVRTDPVFSDGATYAGIQIPPEAIDRIEIIRGPMSVIYGAGAFFGAINIITNDASEANPSMATISYGTEDTVRATVRGAYKNEDASFVFNAGIFSTAGPDNPYSDMSTIDLIAEGLTANSTVEGIWGTEFKFFNFSGKFKGFYADMSYNQTLKGLDLFFPSWDDGADATRSYASISFGYTANISEKFSVDGKFTYHSGFVAANWDWLTAPGALDLGGDNNIHEDYEIDLTAFLNPTEKVSLTGGLYYKKITREQLMTYVPHLDVAYRIGILEPVETKAAYVQGEIKLSDKIKFVAGVRFEQAAKYKAFFNGFSDGGFRIDGNFEHDKVEVLPRFAAIFKLNDKNILKFFYGKAINQPSTFQTAAQGSSGQDPVNSEFIETFELNYLAALSDKFSINTSVFYNLFKDLIVNDPTVENGIWVARNLNSGEMKTLGVELTFNVRPSQKFSMELSGTYQKTDDKRPAYSDITVPYSPEILGYLKATYNFTKDALFSVNARYVGEMETFYDITVDSRIANTADSYFVVGANIRFNNLFKKGYFFSLRASNLLDEQYLFPSFLLNGFFADKGIVGNGRLIVATFGKKF